MSPCLRIVKQQLACLRIVKQQLACLRIVKQQIKQANSVNLCQKNKKLELNFASLHFSRSNMKKQQQSTY